MRRPSLLLGFLLAAACESGMELREIIVIGAIAGYFDDDPHIDVPEAASAGEPFTVTVRTYGNGCTSEGRTDVQVAGGVAVVTPYDLERQGVCHDIQRILDHTTEVTFDAAGAGLVVIQGREDPSGRIITVERQVTVQ